MLENLLVWEDEAEKRAVWDTGWQEEIPLGMGTRDLTKNVVTARCGCVSFSPSLQTSGLGRASLL